MSSSVAAPSIIYVGMDVHKTRSRSPSSRRRPRIRRVSSGYLTTCRNSSGSSTDWRATANSAPATRPVGPGTSASGAPRVGLRLRRDRAITHPEAPRRLSEARQARRRVLFVTAPGAAPRPALEIIQEKHRAQGKTVAQRADLRVDVTSAGRIFALNKADGTIRVMMR